MKTNNGQIKFGVVLGYANYAVKTLIQLLYVPILLKLLGQSEYGVYQLVASVISYLSLLNFGFDGSYLRFYSQCKGDKQRENNLNGTYLFVFSIFAVIAFAVGMILTINTETLFGEKLTLTELNLSKTLMFIMTINMTLSFPISVFSSIITSRECFIFQRLVELLKSLFNPALVIFALLLGYGSIGLVCVSTLLTIVGAIANIWYVFKKVNAKFELKHIEFRLMKEIGAFSFFIFLNSIIDQINWNVDKLLLGRLVGTVAIAIYSVGAQINSIYIQISDLIANFFAPRINNAVANNDNPMPYLEQLWIKVGRIQAFIVFGVLTGFCIYGMDFIKLWAGPEYSDAYYVTLFLIVPVSIPLCQTLGVDIQRALNKHKYRSIVYAIVAISNLIISIPLINHWGAIGAAMGTTISIMIGNIIVMNIMYKKLIGLNIKKFWVSILTFLPSIVPPIIVSLIIRHFVLIDNWYLLIACCIAFFLIYFISLWLIGLNRDEKEYIFHFIKKA